MRAGNPGSPRGAVHPGDGWLEHLREKLSGRTICRRMNLFFRLLRLLLTARWRGRLGPLDESVLKLRVWPVDLDVNLHMNNGRYLSVMDLGRVDVILRTGLLCRCCGGAGLH